MHIDSGMSEEKGPLSGIVKSLNDARYVPALFGVLLVGLVLSSPKGSLSEDTRRRALAAICIFTLAAATIGFVHNQLAWRVINKARMDALKGDDHALKRAEFESLEMGVLQRIIIAYVIAALISLSCLFWWLR